MDKHQTLENSEASTATSMEEDLTTDTATAPAGPQAIVQTTPDDSEETHSDLNGATPLQQDDENFPGNNTPLLPSVETRVPESDLPSLTPDESGLTGNDVPLLPPGKDKGLDGDDVMLPAPLLVKRLESLDRAQFVDDFGLLKEAVASMLSGLYGIWIVVLGMVIPISETFVDPRFPTYFEAYYLFLYLTSIAFLAYVYLYLFRRGDATLANFIRPLVTSMSRSMSRANSFISRSSSRIRVPGVQRQRSYGAESEASSASSVKIRKRRFAMDETPGRHTGSFYLRLGAVVFGVGSMIHSGLLFGHYYEILHIGDACSGYVQAIKPIAKLLFTFFQLYFVFLNSKMCVHHHKILARFGLMHMCATNICVWLRSIVVETLHVIQVMDSLEQLKAVAHENLSHIPNHTQMALLEEEADNDDIGSLPELSCHMDAMMGQVLEEAAYYLYPCTIEYSLICAGVLYVMWNNVGQGGSRPGSATDSSDENSQPRVKRMRVDCAGSSQGLFLGILLFVAAVVVLVAFYVLIGTEEDEEVTAMLVGHISEIIIYLVSLVAVVVGSFKMRNFHINRHQRGGLEQVLIIMSVTGLFIFGMFSIASAAFYPQIAKGTLTCLTHLLMIIQAAAQTIFITAGLRMTANREEARTKAGRQWVTFLLLCNFAMWGINTFETQRAEHNQIQVEFYGFKAWSIFTHVSVPLGIFFRFHSTVCLSNIWKTAWKNSNENVEG